ncbi:hypothetical protein ACS0TY_020674 [Phlomoides rotata]
MNSDASCRSGIGAGVGCVLRDHGGIVLGVSVDIIETDLSIEIAEVVAVRGGMFLAMEKGGANIGCRGGFSNDCKSFDEVSFSWVRRNANYVAHSLGQFIFSCDEPFTSSSIPDELAHIVNVDADLRHV